MHMHAYGGYPAPALNIFTDEECHPGKQSGVQKISHPTEYLNFGFTK